ncbi:MAG: hypothetical protein ACR2Q3_10220 [Woeseiaceae bacterium]
MKDEAGETNSEAENAPEADAEEEFVETEVLPDASLTDNVGDVSVEINVEQLIADIEGEEDADASRKKEVRRKLEEITEERSLEDTYAIEFDSD